MLVLHLVYFTATSSVEYQVPLALPRMSAPSASGSASSRSLPSARSDLTHVAHVEGKGVQPPPAATVIETTGDTQPTSMVELQGPPPLKQAKRFMNPQAELEVKEAKQKRRQDFVLCGGRPSHVPQEVPFTAAEAVVKELSVMARLAARHYQFVIPAAPQDSVSIGGAEARRRMDAMFKDTALDLAWVFRGASQTPLPLVVRAKRYLDNSDARLLFQNGTPRTGQYGAFCWSYDDTLDAAGDDAARVEARRTIDAAMAVKGHSVGVPQPMRCYLAPHECDPILDFILTEDIKEQKEEDGGLMIPFDLRYLVSDAAGHHSISRDGTDTCSDSDNEADHHTPTAPSQQAAEHRRNQYDDSGRHTTFGFRNLLTLPYLRLWQHHNSRTAASTDASSLYAKRSTEVLIDSPRSAFIMARNGQLPSELRVASNDTSIEARRKKLIETLQREYSSLCARMSQRQAAHFLTHLVPPSSLASTVAATPAMLSEQSSPSKQVTRSDASDIVQEQTSEHLRRTSSPSPLRDTSQPRSRNGGFAVVLDAMEAKVHAKSTRQCKSSAMRLSLHREALANTWGKSLHDFTESLEKEKRVAEAVARAREEKILRANGTIREQQRALEARLAEAEKRRRAERREAIRVMLLGGDDGLDELNSRSTHPTDDTNAGQHWSTHDNSAVTATAAASLHSLPASLSHVSPAKKLSPIEKVRLHYEQIEKERIRELERVMKRKDDAVRQTQRKMHEAINAKRATQQARLEDVRAKCDRVRRAEAFRQTIILEEQFENNRLQDELLSRKQALVRLGTDLMHQCDAKSRMTNSELQRHETELAKTLHYESVRRRYAVQSEKAAANDGDGGGGQLVVASTGGDSPEPSIAQRRLPRMLPSTAISPTNSVHSLAISTDGPVFRSRRRKWDAEVTMATRKTLVGLLSSERELEREWLSRTSTPCDRTDSRLQSRESEPRRSSTACSS